MNKFIISAAALLAAAGLASTAWAASPSGHVDVSYARVNADAGAGDTDIDVAGVGGIVAFDLNGLGARVDLDYRNIDPDVVGGSDVDAYGLAGHLFTRSDDWLFGGFAGYAKLDGGAGADSDEWTVGAETQRYLERTTAGASLAYIKDDDADIDAVLLEGDLKHFYTDNFSLGANLGFGNADTGGSDGAVVTAGLGAEYQFASFPVSVFGGYQYADIDDANLDTGAVSVGARWNWGGQSLIERNHAGGDLKRRSLGIGALFGVS